jgi:hypothetical protein
LGPLDVDLKKKFLKVRLNAEKTNQTKRQKTQTKRRNPLTPEAIPQLDELYQVAGDAIVMQEAAGDANANH